MIRVCNNCDLEYGECSCSDSYREYFFVSMSSLKLNEVLSKYDIEFKKKNKKIKAKLISHKFKDGEMHFVGEKLYVKVFSYRPLDDNEYVLRFLKITKSEYEQAIKE